MRRVQVAIASFSGDAARVHRRPADRRGAAPSAGSRPRSLAWDEPDADWERFDRSSSSARPGTTPGAASEFLALVRVGSATASTTRAELVRWNSDKRYLGDLAEAGVPRGRDRATSRPAEPLPELERRGGGEAERLGRRPRHRVASGPAAHELARELIEAIQAQRPDGDGAALSAERRHGRRDRGPAASTASPRTRCASARCCGPTRSRRSATTRSAPPRSCTTPVS